MPKRKADAQGRAKTAAARPPPPSSAANNDGDDSDFCEVIEGPAASPNIAPPSIPPQRSVPPVSIAPRPNPPLPRTPSHGHHGPGNAGVLSMLAGLSGAVPYMQPAAGFGYPQIGGFLQGHPFGYGAPNMLSQAGFRGRGYIPGPTVPLPGAPSSGGVSSGARPSSAGVSSGARPSGAAVSSSVPQPAPARVRVREGLAGQEVKEEPDDTALRPTEAEASLVAVLRAHGVPTDDAVLSLRQNGHDLQAALRQALETVTNRDNNRREDMARLESEKEKERVAAERRHDEMTLTVLGDIEPRFQESLLLDEEEGCTAFRRAIQDLCSGEVMCTPALCAFREKAVKLLFLERNAFRWYREVRPQVRGYFRKLIDRLENFVAGRKAEIDTAGNDEASGEMAFEKAPAQTGFVKTPGTEGVQGTCSGDSIYAAKDKETEDLTACVKDEVDALERILFMIPSTSGGVPDAFLKCSEHAATLEMDGVEEVCHRSADASRSRRHGDRVVIAVDDDMRD